MTMEVMENEQEITVAATTEQIPVISDFIERLMSLAGFDSRKIMEVQLAAEEACTNVAKYAYPGKDGVIHIVARVAWRSIGPDHRGLTEFHSIPPLISWPYPRPAQKTVPLAVWEFISSGVMWMGCLSSFEMERMHSRL